MCFARSSNPPIATHKFPNCSGFTVVTFERWCWLVRQEYNKHVATMNLISELVYDVPVV